ncbi:MAG: hypothetical protein ACM3H9_08085, partial [Rhodospirillaceae bacterium]
MSRNSWRVLLALMVLAAALVWAPDQTIRAAASDPPPATPASTAVTTASVTDPPPAAPAKADTTSTTASTADAGTTAAAAAATPSDPQAGAKNDQPKNLVSQQRQTLKEVQAAAKAARERGLKPGVAGLAGTPLAAPVAVGAMPTYADPGGIPHYFGPYGNWAFSPLPTGEITGFVVTSTGKKYSASTTVTINDAYDATKIASATPTIQGNQVTAITLTPGENYLGYTAPIVTITDPTGSGSGAAATATLSVTGGMPKFVDKLPGLALPGGSPLVVGDPDPKNAIGQYLPVGVSSDCTYSGQAADCYSIALVEFSERLSSSLP